MGEQARNQASRTGQQVKQSEKQLRKALYAKAAEYADSPEEFREYVEIVDKHLIGRHKQKDHDPTSGEGHSRGEHETYSGAIEGAAGGAAGGALTGGVMGAASEIATHRANRGVLPTRPATVARGIAKPAGRLGALGVGAGALLGAVMGADEGGIKADQRNKRKARRAESGGSSDIKDQKVVDSDKDTMYSFVSPGEEGPPGSRDVTSEEARRIAETLRAQGKDVKLHPKHRETSKRLTERDREILTKYLGR